MKRLVFGAALAATSLAFAETPAAQVYDVSLSIKTTAAQYGKLAKSNPFGEGEVVYRKQASKTWKGLIWGCSCETIDGVWEEVNEVLESGYSTIKGCVIWDTKSKEVVFLGDESDLADVTSVADTGFGWEFINAIDKGGNKCEGVWTMQQFGTACEEDAELFYLTGAGFGTLNLSDDCGSAYLKSISGNFAGYMKAPTKEISDTWSGCTFCGYDVEEGSCEFSEAWDYCECVELSDDTVTAAYGTWSVKFNSTLSKKLSKPVKVTDKGLQNFTVSIRDVYNFDKLPKVATAIAAVENTFWQITTPCDDLAATVEAAEKAVAAVQSEVLQAKAKETASAASAAAQYQAACAQAVAETNSLYTSATNSYEQAHLFQTNVAWTIYYINASQQSDFTYGYGTESLLAKIAEFEGVWSLDKKQGGILIGKAWFDTYADAKAEANGIDKVAADLKKIADKREADLNAAKAELESAKADSETKAKEAADAANAYANRTILQLEAEKALYKAEAAYEAAGCK